MQFKIEYNIRWGRDIFLYKIKSDLFSKYTLTNVQSNFDKPKHDDIDKSKMLR